MFVSPLAIGVLAKHWRRSIPGVIAAGARRGAWILFAWLYYGDVLPTSFYAKAVDPRPPLLGGIGYELSFAVLCLFPLSTASPAAMARRSRCGVALDRAFLDTRGLRRPRPHDVRLSLLRAGASRARRVLHAADAAARSGRAARASCRHWSPICACSGSSRHTRSTRRSSILLFSNRTMGSCRGRRNGGWRTNTPRRARGPTVISLTRCAARAGRCCGCAGARDLTFGEARNHHRRRHTE